MTAEEFYKTYYTKHWQPQDRYDKVEKQFDYFDLLDFAETYHKNQLKDK